MASFPIIATVRSTMLGLSATRLLLGLVNVCRIRRVSAVDWVCQAELASASTVQL